MAKSVDAGEVRERVKEWRRTRREWLAAFEVREGVAFPVSFREHDAWEADVTRYFDVTMAEGDGDQFVALQVFPRRPLKIPASLQHAHRAVMRFADATREIAEVADQMRMDALPLIRFERDLCFRPLLQEAADREAALGLDDLVEQIDRRNGKLRGRVRPLMQGRRLEVLKALPSSKSPALASMKVLVGIVGREFDGDFSRCTISRDVKALRAEKLVAAVLRRTAAGDRMAGDL